ncbi:nucleolus protein [Schizophyllum amplum]|uniref:25S rRNA adenine-N(1) methyltransferase n=1 Tax=Schizophyllum amplum TaxID=97359 RepID=A0A550C3T2_9AGAR|nr:nucleolus protein [Auriculariopsis ampla]
MPKARKKKTPVTGPGPSEATSGKPGTTRTVIRRFHVLLKRRAQLEQTSTTRDAATVQELASISAEVDALGGLEKYQEMSAIGQSEDRGGLLEVGALKPDNYGTCQSWIDAMPIDLHSRHPSILEQDFLAMDEGEHRAAWDVVSLSLVVNFVPDAKDRGRMLRLAQTMLKPNGFLFLALPLPCILNSRYVTPEYVHHLLDVIGFSQVKSRWREGGKMAYWLYRKRDLTNVASKTSKDFDLTRKVVLRQGNRNNFAILL